MNAERLLELYDRVAEAPDAVARLRRFVLDLAVRGKLVEKDPVDEPASELHRRIEAEKARLVSSGEFREPRNAVRIEREALPFTPPPHWGWSRLIEMARPGYGFAFSSSLFNSERRGMPLIRIRDISRSDTEAYYDGDYDPAYIVRRGDYLVGMDGDFNLRCWQGKEALLNQRVMRINGWRCGVSPDFVRIPLQMVLDYLHGDTSLTTVKHLSAKQVNGIEIPLPPLGEQHRIVEKVGELMALCDRLEEARTTREATRDHLTTASLARLTAPDTDEQTFRSHARFALDAFSALTTRPDQIKALRQTILNLAVRGKLVKQDPADGSVKDAGRLVEQYSEELPNHWACVQLKHLLVEGTRNGYSRKPDDDPNGVPILRISAGTAREDGFVAEEEHKLISGVDHALRREYSLRAGDLLACRFNGNKFFVGRFAVFKNYLGIDPIYPDKLIRIRVDLGKVIPDYLRLAGDSDLVRAALEELCATTVGNWGISATKLKEVVFPVPPTAEQKRIVARVYELMALCDRLTQCQTAADGARRRLLESLLRDALEPFGTDLQVA